MKFTVFEGVPKPDGVVRLRLVPLLDGREVVLRAVDASGGLVNRGNLLTISKDGVHRHHAVSPDLGIAVDGGRLVDS